MPCSRGSPGVAVEAMMAAREALAEALEALGGDNEDLLVELPEDIAQALRPIIAGSMDDALRGLREGVFAVTQSK